MQYAHVVEPEKLWSVDWLEIGSSSQGSVPAGTSQGRVPAGNPRARAYLGVRGRPSNARFPESTTLDFESTLRAAAEVPPGTDLIYDKDYIRRLPLQQQQHRRRAAALDAD